MPVLNQCLRKNHSDFSGELRTFGSSSGISSFIKFGKIIGANDFTGLYSTDVSISSSETNGMVLFRVLKINTNILSINAIFSPPKSPPNNLFKTPKAAKSAVIKHPDSPLINLLATTPSDFSTYKAFASKFPKQASASYNMMSYAYLRGDFGEPNKEMAMDYVKRSQQMHDGPNSYDSMAEHYASMGDYQKAFELQLKAVDFARFGSPYWNFARIYYAKVNQDDLSKQLMKNQKEVQDAITARDYKTYSKYEHPDINHMTGDSNLSPFYEFSKASFEEAVEIDWTRFDLENMDVNYSPDMKTAVLTFYATGSYVFKESNKEVAYSTRGSSVWVNTDQGWKIMHSSWAPNQDGIGIPK